MKTNMNSLTDQDVLKILEQIRWDKQKNCPHCGCNKTIDYVRENKFQCENCFRSFSVISKTEFENTKLPLGTWLWAYFLIRENKGVHASNLNKMLNVTQKTSTVIHEKITKILNEKNWLNKISDLPIYKNQFGNYYFS